MLWSTQSPRPKEAIGEKITMVGPNVKVAGQVMSNLKVLSIHYEGDTPRDKQNLLFVFPVMVGSFI